MIEDHPGSIARGLVTDLAEAHLQGWKGPVKYTEWLEACRVATPEAIRSRFAEAYRQSFLIADLPGDILDGLEGIILPKSEPLLGIEFRYRGRLRVPEKVDPDAEQLPAAIRVGPDGVSIRWREGWTNEPPTQIALIISENGWIRIEAAYTSLTFDARKYRRRRTGDRGFSGDRSKTIDEAMRKYLPPDLFLPSIREGMREQGVAHPKRHEPQPR